MTKKFERDAGQSGSMPAGGAEKASNDWDDFLSEFKNDDDIAVTSLEDLGLDDDFALSELQNADNGISDPAGRTSRFEKLKSESRQTTPALLRMETAVLRNQKRYGR